jgi:RNA polymerase sigma-70 factor (ECF subfamily)
MQVHDRTTVLPTDIELMQRIAQADQAALSTLYQRYGSIIYSLALRVLQNTGLAEEVTQDVFLEVWNRPQIWDPNKGRLSSWMLTICRYTAIDRLRKDQRRPETSMTPLEDLAELLSTISTTDDALWQDGQMLRTFMSQLPTEQAEVIEMAFFQGLTHSELAETLHLPLGTIKTRVRLGLKKLRSLWTSANDESES